MPENLTEKQAIIDRLFATGRLHVAGGNSLFDYPGAIFSAGDFLPENAERLEEKLENVVQTEARTELFIKNNPNYEFTPDRPHYGAIFTQIAPKTLHPNEANAARQALRKKITQQLTGLAVQNPQVRETEQKMFQQLARFPQEELKWLHSSPYEIAYSADSAPNPDGIVTDGNHASLYPAHPACASWRNGGGCLIPWEGKIPYAYVSEQRDPKLLIAHELFGHGLHAEAKKIYGSAAVDQLAYQAVASDLGDLNKRTDVNPSANMGRIGKILAITESGGTSLEIYGKLKALDPNNTPAFHTDEGRRQWAEDITILAGDAKEKMGPEGWMYHLRAECYNDPEAMMKELIAAYAELKYVESAEHPEQLQFLLPEMTQFWERYPAKAMNLQLQIAVARELGSEITGVHKDSTLIPGRTAQKKAAQNRPPFS